MVQVFLTLTPDIEQESILARIQDVIKNPAPDVNIIQGYDLAGKLQWIQWVDYGIQDEFGVIAEIQAVGRDVTPLMNTQHKLAERGKNVVAYFG